MGIDIAQMMVSLSRNSHTIKIPERNIADIKDPLPEHQIKLLESIIQQSEISTDESERDCPECNRKLVLVEIKDILIDSCRFCKSIWFDSEELKSITRLLEDIPSDNLRSRESKYNCPVCKTKMIEYIFKAPNNLLVDQCTHNHGVYLESSELERVFRILNEE